MLRIALVTPAFQARVGEPFVPYWADLVAELAGTPDVSVTVFPLRFPAAEAPYDLYGARIVPLPHGHVPLRRSPALWAAAVLRIVDAHRSDRAASRGDVDPAGQGGFDVIHALHGNEAGFVAALAAKRLGVPLAVHLGGGELAGLRDIGYGSKLYPWERAQVAVALRSADLVTVGSRAMAGVARGYLGPDRAARVRWAPLGVDTRVFRPARGGPRAGSDRSRHLLHVGELNPVKDQATLLRAFARLDARHRDAVLDIVGGGPQAGRLRALAGRLGIGHRIRWWGQIPRPAVELAFARADAFALSSRHEGQGMVLAEAAACGLPIATTRVGMASDLPAEGVQIAAPGDVEGLARAMAWALDAAWDDVARPGIARAMRDAAVRDYDVRACVARWRGLYGGLRREEGAGNERGLR